MDQVKIPDFRFIEQADKKPETLAKCLSDGGEFITN
jgi:hypothetical protein